MLVSRCHQTDDVVSPRDLIKILQTNTDKGKPCPYPLSCVVFGKNLVLRFETEELANPFGNFKFEYTKGHFLKAKKHRSPVSTTYFMKNVSVVEHEDVCAAPVSAFPERTTSDCFSVLSEDGCRLDHYFVAFWEEPRRVTKMYGHLQSLTRRVRRGIAGNPN
jgi:hypothetical protein